MKISFLAFAAASILRHASARISGGNHATTHDSNDAEEEILFLCGSSYSDAKLCALSTECLLGDQAECPAGYNCWAIPASNCVASPTSSPLQKSGDFLQIGDWRLARTCETCDRSIFSISSQAHGKTSQILRDDGTYHAGPRTDFNGFDLTGGDGLAYSSQPIVFGDKAVQIRDWRIRQVHPKLLSVTNENGNVSRIYRSDGTVHGNVKEWSGYINEDLGEPTCAYLTSSFLQLGDWRFGEMGGHLSVTHKDGQTAMIYRHDGTIHPGPRTDYNAWTLVDDDVLAGTREGCNEDYVQIGDWRLARTCETCDRSIFSISSQAHGYTSQIFRDDGTYHAGPRTDFNGFDLSGELGLTRASIVFGDKAVQIRDWRIRQVDSTHLSVTNENGNVSRIYRSDGTVYGNSKGFGGYVIEDLGEPTCAYLTLSFLQLGDWRFGEMGGHLVVTHKDGQTAMIYRHDGTIHAGPRTDHDAWTLIDDEVLAGTTEGCPLKPNPNPFQGTLNPEDSGIWSPNGQYQLRYQDDGNLVLYQRDQLPNRPIWASGTDGLGTGVARMQDDGNLVVYDARDPPNALWSSETRGHYGAQLELNNNGSLVISDADENVWSADYDYLQIGDWGLARTCENCDVSHFSISSQAHGYTSQIFRDDGTYHAGPRTDFNGFDLSGGDGLTYSSQPIVFGDKSVQIRDWRIRQVDSTHLSVTNENGNVSRIYRSDGTVHGNVKEWSGYINEDLGEPTCAYLTSLFLQLGDWRFGEMGGHLVVTHRDGKTATIYVHDGTVHPGPRTDYNAWTLVDDEVLAGTKDGCEKSGTDAHQRRIWKSTELGREAVQPAPRVVSPLAAALTGEGLP
ncbi:hypothetical protein THAOC_34979 [Thalassiosira oceanica]|uniref:Bulb-type lectin domain-containing protein n=1 Tax=Thalassiosira oceanica TaxID=159749 RepID=K0RB96_THAOC|nr:hypothetical protein THAOC_34979 [Thalassiosira oceanica]|eukprot:EJK46356.1 hypothetical protein THAOC_34979 [Thalassiosira oceanica]